MIDHVHKIRRLADELDINVTQAQGGWVIENEPGPLGDADAVDILQSIKAERWRNAS